MACRCTIKTLKSSQPTPCNQVLPQSLYLTITIRSLLHARGVTVEKIEVVKVIKVKSCPVTVSVIRQGKDCLSMLNKLG